MKDQKINLESVENSLNSWLKPKRFGESWDNTGLLVESSRFSKKEKCVNRIFLCNDLTIDTLQEAIDTQVDLIIAYHPPIFPAININTIANPRPNSSLTWKDEIIAKCMTHDIAIYSPHTSLDAVIGGINDRIINSFRSLLPLCQSDVVAIKPKFLQKNSPGISITSTADRISALYNAIPFPEMDTEVTVSFIVDDISDKHEDRVSLNIYLSKTGKEEHLEKIQKIVEALKMDGPAAEHTSVAPVAALGSGRILSFHRPVGLENITETLKKVLGVPTLQLAQASKKQITRIAVCVGSGAAYLKGLDVDAVITGEMTHRDVLDFLQVQQSVILCGHAESERHYLYTLAEIVKMVTQISNVTISTADKCLFKSV